MPIINASTLGTENLKGADYGATISLILDHSQHRDPGCTDTHTTRLGSSRKETSPSNWERSATRPARATSSSPLLACRTSSLMTVPGPQASFAFTPTRPW